MKPITLIQYIHRNAVELSTLSLGEAVEVGAIYGALAALCVLATRSVYVWLGRIFGFYSPEHYRWFPRLPWRSAMRVWMALSGYWERVFRAGKRSTGGFLGPLSTLTQMFKPGKLYLGRAYALGIPLLQGIGIAPRRHVYINAMTGSNKTTSIISMLATWRGSAMVVDAKGQITYALAQLDGREWSIWDPYGLTPFASASINFFDCIDEAVERGGENAAIRFANHIAYAFLVTPKGSRSPFFYDVSRTLLAGLILFVYVVFPKENHNLPFVRKLITHGLQVADENGTEPMSVKERHELLLRSMSRIPSYDGAIAGAAAAMIKAAGEAEGNLWATLQDATSVLDNPDVAKSLMRTTLPLSDLKLRDDCVLSLVAPVSAIRGELAPIIRVTTNLLAATFEAVPKKKGLCLTVVDELPSLGRNEVFLTTLAVGRSTGQVFCGIGQNLGQLKSVYGEDYAQFLSECDFVLWLGCNHPENVNYLHALLGRVTRCKRIDGRRVDQTIDVMTKDQLARFLDPDSGRMIVTRAGKRPLRLMSDPYFKALSVRRYRADPDHRETLFRRLTRRLLGGPGLLEKAKPQTPLIPEASDPIPESTQPEDNHEQTPHSD